MKFNPHRWVNGLKSFRFTFCAKCGLVWLNNEASEKAANKQCKGEQE